jgi:CheY-like chemotaxis protein
VLLNRDRRVKKGLVLSDTVVVEAKPLPPSSFMHGLGIAAGLYSPVADAIGSAGSYDRIEVPSIEEAEKAGRLILVAEDNVISQEVIRRQLNLLGYAAEVVPDGAAALKAMAKRNYGLLLSDCHMPELDGFELARRIRKWERQTEGRHLPIIAITANALRGEADRCLAAGMDGFLSKPVELDRLRETIIRWMPVTAGDSSGRRRKATTRRAKGKGGKAMHERINGAEAVDRLPEDKQMEHGNMETVSSEATVDEGLAGPPVDMGLLATILGNEDPAYLKKMLVFFWDTMAETPNELSDLINRRDAAQLRDAAHSAKGASASAGAQPLAKLLEQLQHAAADEDWATIETLAPKVDQTFADLKAYIHTFAR